MQRGFAHLFLIIIILIILVAGGIFLFKNSTVKNSVPNPVSTIQKIAQTSNTANYSNTNLGFSFNYQKDLIVKEDSEKEFNTRGNGDFRKNFRGYVGYEPPAFAGAVAVLGKDNNFDNNPLTIWVFNNTNNLTIEQWFTNFWYYPFVWGVFDYASKSKIVMDQEATVSGELAKSKIVAYQPGSPKFVYIAKEGKMYLFRIIDDKDHTGDQILSSFKFTI